jgi:hypothetical protein
MPDIPAVTVVQPEQSQSKPSINPDAFYRYDELEKLGLGKYLKFRRAIKRGALVAYYSGRNVLIKGSDALAFIGATQK